MEEAVFKDRSKLTPTAEMTFEFLRRVVNELKGRRFEYIDEPCAATLTVQAKANELLHVLPEITREFAGKIPAGATRCFKVITVPNLDHQYSARDPFGGVSIRGVRIWDVMHGEIVYRFDAAFS